MRHFEPDRRSQQYGGRIAVFQTRPLQGAIDIEQPGGRQRDGCIGQVAHQPNQRDQKDAGAGMAEIILPEEQAGQEQGLAFGKQRHAHAPSGEAQKDRGDEQSRGKRNRALVTGEGTFSQILSLDGGGRAQPRAQQGGGQIHRTRAGK